MGVVVPGAVCTGKRGGGAFPEPEATPLSCAPSAMGVVVSGAVCIAKGHGGAFNGGAFTREAFASKGGGEGGGDGGGEGGGCEGGGEYFDSGVF